MKNSVHHLEDTSAFPKRFAYRGISLVLVLLFVLFKFVLLVCVTFLIERCRTPTHLFDSLLYYDFHDVDKFSVQEIELKLEQ